MDGITKLVVAVAVATAVGFAGGTWVGERPEPVPYVPDDGGVADLAARMDRLEERGSIVARRERRTPDGAAPNRRIAELTDHIEQLDARILELTAECASMRLALASNASAAPASKVSTTVDRAERLRALSDTALLAEVRGMVHVRGQVLDGAGIVAGTEELLGRSLSAAERSQALSLQGIGYRVLKDRTREEAAFHAALAAAEPGTPEALEANVQLAWTASRHGDPNTAADRFLRLAEDPDSNDSQRAYYRYYAAGQFAEAGDRDRAITEYRRVVETFGESDNAAVRRVAEQARGALSRIEKR